MKRFVAAPARSRGSFGFARLAVLAALAVASALVACRTTPAALGDEPLPLDPELIRGRLANGLVYYLRENRRPENTAELRLVVDAGSVLEEDDQRGMAHFVEHMAFNGTENFPAMELVKHLESMGIEFGPEINASTSFDETIYRLQVPTRTWENLDTGLRILADWAARVRFDSEQIRKERGVIVEEWRTRRGAEARIRDRQLPVLLAGSRYAERLPIGLLEVIERGPEERLRDFYRDWYRPDLMAVIAVGDFDARRVEDRIRELFGSLARPEVARPKPVFEVPDHPGVRYAIATDPEATASRVALYVKRPVQRVRTVADYRAAIVESLFVAMLNARLDEATRAPESPLLEAGSGRTDIVRSLSVTYLGGRTRDGEILRGLESLLVEMERVRRYGFTASELARHKEALLSGVERLYLERENTPSASYVREYIGNFLEEEPVPGIAYEYELHRRFVPGVSLDEVNSLAANWIATNNATLFVSAPQKPGVPPPAEGELAAVFERVAALPLAPYRDLAREEPLVPTPPARGRIVEERRIDAIGVIVWRLANGAEVYLKPTDFKKDEILLRALSPGGTSLGSDEDYPAAVTAVGALREAGLGGFSRIELEKKLAGKQVSLVPYISEIYEGLEGGSSARDLETLLQLVYLTFTAPRSDEEAFRAYRERLREQAEARKKDPDRVFWDTVRFLMANRDPRAKPLEPEQIAHLSGERWLAVFKDRFASGGDFTFVLVGSFDPEAVRPLVETYLGGLPGARQHESWRDRGVSPPGGKVEETVRMGVDPVGRVQYVFAGPLAWSQEQDMVLEALAGVLQSRLTDVLREEQGGTYGVSVFASTSKNPRGEYRVSIGFGCDPGRIEELSKIMFEELEAAAEGRLDAGYVAKQKEILKRNLELAVRTNAYWADEIATSLRRLEDPAELARREALIEAIRSETLAAAARRVFSEDRYIRVVLLPASAEQTTRLE